MDSTFRLHRTIELSDQARIFAVASVFTTVVLFLSWLNTRKVAQHGLRLPPGPRGWPVIGSLLKLSAAPHVSFADISAKYGPLVYLHLGSVPTLVVGNSDMAEEVLKVNDQNMASRPDMMVLTYAFYNRLDVATAPYGTHWRQARKICTVKLFSPSRWNHFQGTRKREVLAMVQSILQESERQGKAGHGVNMERMFYSLTMNVITQIMWRKSHRTYKSISTGGVPNNGDEVAEGVKELMVMFSDSTSSLADYIPALRVLYLRFEARGFMKKLRAVRGKFDGFLEQIIHEHKSRTLAKPTMGTTDSGDADDFVDVLLKSEAEENLPRDATKAILVDMLVAGTDTIATTLEWAVAEIIRNPKWMKKAQEELDSVVGRDRLVTEADAPHLKFVQAIIKETLRLHPPAPLPLPHESIADCKIAGYDIPGKTRVFINVHQIHRDPTVWERPLEFDPERFLGSREEAGIDWKGHDYKLVPFTAGRRQCLGMNFSGILMDVALAQAIHAIEWSLPANQRPEDLDMTPALSHIAYKNEPLTILGKPRLAHPIIYPSDA